MNQKDKFFILHVSHKYRAKNSFGALMILRRHSFNG
jgi:hypothetical protein